MPDVTVKRPYPKADNSKADVQKVQQQILANKSNTGAKSCDLSEDDTNWYLTTVYETIC
jgi:uncharacterized ParB-like nuclease family protein